MIDVPLLRKAVEWVEEQEKLPTEERGWYQGSWGRRENAERTLPLHKLDKEEQGYCGTNMCLAGHIAVLAGWEIEYDWRGFGNFCYATEATKGGRTLDIQDIAIKELGADKGDNDLSLVHNLFHGENTAHDIRQSAEMLAGERL